MNSDNYFFSTIGRKQLMGLAGLALAVFVLGHAAGNLLMFIGPDTYNKYGHALVKNPLLYVAEAGLVLFFSAHVLAGIVLTIRNFSARPQNYAVAAKGAKATSKTTKTMWLQGIVLLGFIILHLITFKYGTYYEITIDGVVMRDLFRLLYEVFQSPWYVTWYIVALLILCFHLAHGVHSALQSLGANHPKYTPAAKCVSVFYGLFVAFAFIAQPVYMYFFYKG